MDRLQDSNALKLSDLLAAADCIQARQDGTLDGLVVSLETRRGVFNNLDLIPPEYTYEVACAAVQAPQGSPEPGPAPLPAGSKRHLPDSAQQQQGHTQQHPCLLQQVLPLFCEHSTASVRTVQQIVTNL
jgi:hypothetical protein